MAMNGRGGPAEPATLVIPDYRAHTTEPTQPSHGYRARPLRGAARGAALAPRWCAGRYSPVVAVVGFASPNTRRCRWLRGGRAHRGCIVRAPWVAVACAA